MYDGNPGEIDFGSSQREVRVSEGSSYRESTVSRYVCAYNFILSARIICLFIYLTCTFSSFINILILLCVIFLTYTVSVTVLTLWVAPPKMFCNWYIGFNGAETNCGIARILDILLMNSCDCTYIFFSN